MTRSNAWTAYIRWGSRIARYEKPVYAHCDGYEQARCACASTAVIDPEAY